MATNYDKWLTNILKDAEGWLAHNDGEDLLGFLLGKLGEDLNEAGPLSKGAQGILSDIGRYFGNQACVAFGSKDTQTVAIALLRAVGYRSLSFRFGAIDLPDGSGRVGMLPFTTSMKAVGPAMLSEWQTMILNAQLLIDYAEAEMAHNTQSELAQYWGKGTVDAFVIALLSQAFNVPTTYAPVNPMVPELQGLLTCWRTTDKREFQDAMQRGAKFHISRGRGNTKHVMYEFNALFDAVFPAELLAVQALRQRDGLPFFETGSLLIDAPWAMIQELPPTEPDPLLAQVEARLQADYLNFK